jgi:hypothetical protein
MAAVRLTRDLENSIRARVSGSEVAEGPLFRAKSGQTLLMYRQNTMKTALTGRFRRRASSTTQSPPNG